MGGRWTAAPGAGRHANVTDSSNQEGAEGQGASGEGGGERKPLPTWNRSRTKKKKTSAADEEDAFQRGMRQGSTAAKKQWRLVVLGCVGASALVAGVLFAMDMSTQQRSSQTRKIAAAAAVGARGVVVEEDQLPQDLSRTTPDPLFTSADARREALENYLSELDAESSKVSLGDLMRAAAQVRGGDFDGALTSYEAFLGAEGTDHPLRFLALEGKGIALENKGSTEDALAVYQDLAGRKGSFYRDMALWHQGRALESLGREAEALEVYKTYIQEFPPEVSSLAREQVRGRLEQLDPEALQPAAAPENDAAPAAAPEGDAP